MGGPGTKVQLRQIPRAVEGSEHASTSVADLEGPIVRKTLTILVAALTVAAIDPVPSALAAGGGGTGSGADLQVSGSASTGSPVAGTPFIYAFQIKNSGPSAASATTFTDQLP